MKLQGLCNRAAFGLLLAACSASKAPKAPEALPPNAQAHPLALGSVAAAVTHYTALGPSGPLAQPALAQLLGEQHVLCLGEQHDNLAHHGVQLLLVRGLLDQAVESKHPVAIGLEMFSLADQPALDEYARGTITEAELLAKTSYADHWGYDFEYYRAVLEWGRARGAKLLALNAPKEWTKAVVTQGEAGLQSVQADLASKDLVLDDAEHQRFFAAAMAGHASVHGYSVDASNLQGDPMYMAQVVWDETMARQAARWLASTGPDGRVIVLAGAGHCHRSAVPRRMERRLPGVRTLGVRLLTRSDMLEQTRSGYMPVPANHSYELLIIAEQ
jgi:uncharacterized iron-regulated protein